jgi:hypothetical protein
METDATSHVSQIDAGTYMNTAEQREAWMRQCAGLRSVIQAYGSHAPYESDNQAAYQPAQQPHAYYGTAGMILRRAVMSRHFFYKLA